MQPEDSALPKELEWQRLLRRKGHSYQEIQLREVEGTDVAVWVTIYTN